MIYIYSLAGRWITRLTNNEDRDLAPFWAPRKRGVEVTEVMVSIRNLNLEEPLTTQEVTRKVSESIVKIETDLGSGSGLPAACGPGGR